MNIVDMHCHILPGVDDGPKTMEETLETLRMAQQQGIRAMIVTPHFHPGRYLVKGDCVLETLKRVRRVAADEGIDLSLYPGQECYYYSGLISELESGNVLTMNGTRYVLVEFENETQYSTMSYAVRELRDNGYKPIIAHFERYRCLYQRKERLEELKRGEAKLQLNFDRLIEKGNLLHPNPWRKLFKDGLVDFLGSDTHGMVFRPLHVDRATKWISAGVSPEVRRRVLVDNPKLLLPQHTQRG